MKLAEQMGYVKRITKDRCVILGDAQPCFQMLDTGQKKRARLMYETFGDETFSLGGFQRQICGRRLEMLIRSLETAREDFTESLWSSMVEKVTVFKDALVFTLTSGEEVRVAPC